MTGVTAISDFYNRGVELVIEPIGSEIKGPGRGSKSQNHFICVDQGWHDGDFHSLDTAIRNHTGPVSQVSGDFPLPIGSRDNRKAWICFIAINDEFQSSAVFIIDR